MRLVPPDLEAILPGIVYTALQGKYSRLFTDRAAPADLAGRPVVVLQYAGGPGGAFPNDVRDWARMSVDIYAPTEKQANDLSRDVRAVLEEQGGHSPIIEVSTTVPLPITVANRGPQRQFYAEVLSRKALA